MVEILGEVAKLGSVIAILIAAIIYFINKEKAYKADIKELNKVIRESEKANLEILNKLADAVEGMNSKNKLVHQEIVNLKDVIKDRLDNIKNDLNK